MTDLQKRYALIVIKMGIALKKGQCVQITTGQAHYDFALLLADTAYREGARYVDIIVSSNRLTRSREQHSSEEDLSWYPEYYVYKSHQMMAEDWAVIRIENTEEMSILRDASPDRLAVLNKTSRMKLKHYTQSLMNDDHRWCVIGAPGPEWAKEVLGNSATADDLWKILMPVLRLDQADPVAAWQKHSQLLLDRSRKLTDMHLDYLHFKSAKTDLKVGLAQTSRWIGGPCQSPDGTWFLPNIPTEEIFSTPDYRRTEGTVAVTRPVNVMENQVEGAVFTFKEGRVVDFDAAKSRDILGKFLALDQNAPYLGEVALVDAASPIYQSGRLFKSILFDENASCHIALGAGYPICLTNSKELLSDDDKKNAGCNVSLVHTDFMIGSDDLDVDGYTPDGKCRPLIRRGVFVME